MAHRQGDEKLGPFFSSLQLLWLLCWSCTAPSPPAPRAGPGDAALPVVTQPAAPDAAPRNAPVQPPATLAALHAHDAERCADCHPDEVEAWAQSAMGQAIGPLTNDAVRHGLPVEITHPHTGLTYRAHGQGRALTFTERALDGHLEARAATYAIGSGVHTRSFLWQRGAQFLVAPITRYTAGPRWDLSPGYRAADHPGLFRTVQADCLHCHADPGALKPGTQDHWLSPPAGAIGCARCHGDVRAHATAREDGRDAPVIMPARLSPDRAAALCDQCHLQGEVRILRPGRAWSDFRPGMALSEVVAVFVRQAPDAGFGIASHGVRLRRSRCRTAEDTPLHCTTCHQPHPTGPRIEPNRVCQGCHTGADHRTTCAAPAGSPAPEDCVRCHMPRGAVDDIPHTAATDHYIRRAPGSGPPAQPDAPLIRVGAPHGQSPADALLLGRAYAEAVRASGQLADLKRSAPLLRRGLTAHPEDLEGWLALTFVTQLTGPAAQARAAIEAAQALAPADARVAGSAAAIHLAGGDPAAALRDLAPALAHTPDQPMLHVHHAHALAASMRPKAARAAAERALKLQPSLGPAWMALAITERTEGRTDAARATLRMGIARAPTHVTLWLNLGQLALMDGLPIAARDAFAGAQRFALAGDTLTRARAEAGQGRAVLQLGDVQAAARHLGAALKQPIAVPGLDALTGSLAVAPGRFVDGQRALEQAVRADPSDRIAWAWLAKARDAARDTAGAARARQKSRTAGP
jgi:tetratricopeptide (TPR) repeat protein